MHSTDPVLKKVSLQRYQFLIPLFLTREKLDCSYTSIFNSSRGNIINKLRDLGRQDKYLFTLTSKFM